MMREWAEKCKQWIEDGHIIWAYFNNTDRGYALKNARQLKDMLEGK